MFRGGSMARGGQERERKREIGWEDSVEGKK